jgi:hypothetical protein
MGTTNRRAQQAKVKAYKRRAQQAKVKAYKRNQALWDHYNANGILLMVDFKRLTEGQYQAVLDTFDTYGLKSPPVYDSRREQYKRKARQLREGAAKLGQDYLTISQAAKILNIKPGRLIGIEGQLLRAGCTLPDIVMDETKLVLPHQESREYTEFAGRMNGICNPLYYPVGLQVVRYWEGPGENEVTYLLR